MKNSYGVKLDRNGYAPSIMNDSTEARCFICGRMGILQRHEIYGGPFRDESKALGLWLNLCPECHHYIHFIGAPKKLELRKQGQRVAQKHYGWTDEEFRERFGKCYE